MKVLAEKLHFTESYIRLGGVETLIRQMIATDKDACVASLLDSFDNGSNVFGLRPTRWHGAFFLRRNARSKFLSAKYLIFHNYAGLTMLSAVIPHQYRVLFLHTNSEDVYALLEERARFLHLIIVSGASLYEEIVNRFPSLGVSICKIEYPIDDVFFSPVRRDRSSRVTTIGFAGRLEIEQKQVMRLVQLCRELQLLGIPFRLEIAGEGSAEAELRQGLPSEGVDFMGTLTSNELRDRLCAWDYLVCVSDYETGPLVALEAMACGTIPILPSIRCQATDLTRDTDLSSYRAGDMADAARLIAGLEQRGVEAIRTQIKAKIEGRSVLAFMTDFENALSHASNSSMVPLPAISKGIREFLPFVFRSSKSCFLR